MAVAMAAPIQSYLSEVQSWQLIAIENLVHWNHPVYTSPRALRQFIQSTLLEVSPRDTGCTNHELILLDTQSYETEDTCFVSAVCRQCRYHFHIKNDTKHSRLFDTEHHAGHMLVAYDKSQGQDIASTNIIAEARLICINEGCYFNVEVCMMRPKLSTQEFSMLADKDRVVRNLQRARIEDPDRFLNDGTPNNFGQNAPTTLRQYLSDCLELEQRPIKKKNKRFMVSFHDNFDPLLRSLEFREGRTSQGEQCWFFPPLEPAQSPTPVDSPRALIEDARAEVELLTEIPPNPAWTRLLRAFHGEYQSRPVSPDRAAQILETDLELLGCLRDYPGDLFTWASILLSQRYPARRDAFLDAGLRCLEARADDCLRIILFRSELTKQPEGGHTNVEAATKFLEIELNYTPELIKDIVMHRYSTMDHAKVVKALESVASFKQQQGNADQAAEVQKIASNINNFHHPATDVEIVNAGNMPIGLKNIGNTCYLNSLLQYFYNVKVIRELVLNYDDIKLELDESTIAKRRTGGSGASFNLSEAIVARLFVEMLRNLFRELETTNDMAAVPAQKLANAALSSAKDILNDAPEAKPPPLPARHSQNVNVTVQPVNDQLDTASSHSSLTLIDDLEFNEPESSIREHYQASKESPDTVFGPEPPGDPSPTDEKITQISRRLEHSERSGTAQQDAEEVIGHMFEHFSRGVHSTGPIRDKPDLQADLITNTFFTMVKAFTETSTIDGTGKQALKRSVEIRPERLTTAYPHPGAEKKKRTLHEALEPTFSYQSVGETNVKTYTVISRLPPILHICIQRTGTGPNGEKNKNPVIIPEDLYMDRYMEADDGSTLDRSRRRVWAVKQLWNDLTAVSLSHDTNASTNPAPTYHGDMLTPPPEPHWPDVLKTPPEPPWPDSPESNKRKHRDAFENDPSKSRHSKRISLSQEDGEQMAGKFKAVARSQEITEILSQELRTCRKVDQVERVAIEELQDDDFDALEDQKYTVHAIICHSGGMSAGHYWVWIRDFAKGVWYKFNDNVVTEFDGPTQTLLDELNEGGDPYYIAYVRDEMKNELAEVPLRQRPGNELATPPNEDVEMETIDVVPQDDVKMLPPHDIN